MGLRSFANEPSSIDINDPEVADIQNVEIRKLVISLRRMPEYLAEQRRKAQAKREFIRYVWEQACRDAGLVK